MKAFSILITLVLFTWPNPMAYSGYSTPGLSYSPTVVTFHHLSEGVQFNQTVLFRNNEPSDIVCTYDTSDTWFSIRIFTYATVMKSDSSDDFLGVWQNGGQYYFVTGINIYMKIEVTVHSPIFYSALIGSVGFACKSNAVRIGIPQDRLQLFN